MTERTAVTRKGEHAAALTLQPIQFLNGDASQHVLRRHLSASVDVFSARQILEHLLVLGSPKTGSDYLQAVVDALNARLHATSIFVAFRTEPTSERVRVLAACKDGAPRELWEYSLTNNPCQLVYNGEATFIPCSLAEHFPGKRGSGYESFIGIPLKGGDGQVLGHIAVYDAEPVADTELRVALVQVLAARAACELERQSSLLRLQRQATTDELTGLLNRHGFNAVASSKFHAASRSDKRLFFVSFDLDGFKQVNDSYGHIVGDAVLVEFACALASGFARRSDVLARTGGDEFVALVSAADLVDVEAVATKVRNSFSTTAVPTAGGAVYGACSFGIGEYDANDRTLVDLAARADAALYRAKPGRQLVS